MKIKIEIYNTADLDILIGIIGFHGHKVWREDLGTDRNKRHYLIIEIDKSCISEN